MLSTRPPGKKRKIPPSTPYLPLYPSLNDKSQLLHLKAGYQMHPSAAQIVSRHFLVTDLTIKHMSTTAVWKGQVDLRYLRAPLSELVELGRTHIEVYPDERDKPVAGRELNRVCFVTFGGLKRVSRRKLNAICESNQCELLALDQGKFTVEIPHFSKYAFNAEIDEHEDENEEPMPEAERNKQSPQSIVNKLKQIHNQRIIQQKQQARTNLSVSALTLPQHPNKSPTPTFELLKQIETHNLEHGHRMVGDRIKGTPMTIGINCVASSYISSTNLHFMLFNRPKGEDRGLLGLVLGLMKDQKKVNQIVLDPAVSFQVKRVLVLNLICFQFGQCLFDFKRNGETLELVKLERPPDQHYQIKYFKNWFEWVINQNPQSLNQNLNNQMIKALVLRRTAQQADKCQRFNQKLDAEFLASIEDQSYRCGEPPKNLCKELRAISIGNMSYFQGLSWLNKFAVTLWYYSFNQPVEEKLRQIVREGVSEQYDYNLERNILVNFLKIPFNDALLTSVQESDYPLWYYIENKNKNTLIVDPDSKGKSKYAHYRYNLVAQLIDAFADGFVALELVSYDNFIQKTDKAALLRNFISKYPGEAERVPITEWKDYSDLINNAKAYMHFSNRDYLRSLEYFGRCHRITQGALIVLENILLKQEILCNFHPKTAQKTRRLIQKLPFSQPQHALQHELVTYLNISLHKEQLTRQSLLAAIRLCKRIARPDQRQKMLQTIFKEAIKTPLIISELKKDKGKDSLYQHMKAVYTDPAYLLELKLAKLQL